MTESPKLRKQMLVRDAIFQSAIELFARQGFDQTTVEEVAHAAGVSRRTFFRYFTSKDDLLAVCIVQYGESLLQTITSCAAGMDPMAMVRATVMQTVASSGALPRTRQIVQIAVGSRAARQAYQSRLIDVEDALAAAYARKLPEDTPPQMLPRMLAMLTLMVMNIAIGAWYHGECEDLDAAADEVLLRLRTLFEAMQQAPAPRR
ncbi:MAG: TetR family transcriptional regulator [Acidobacteriota bacterium]|nr:TetR family transcriptional regulator [Acidobacteriota bacterium]